MSGVWYKRSPADFIYGVRKLNLEERGLYATLLEMFYEEGGMIAGDNPAYLANQCGCSTRKFNSILGTLIKAGKIIEFEGYLTNKRVLSQLKPEFMSRLSQDKREIILSKSCKNNDLSGGKKLKKLKNPPNPPEGEPEFVDFYEGYLSSHRRGRDKAERAWRSLSEADARSALAALPAYLAEVTAGRMKPVTPASFLRGRWFDQIAPARPATAPPPSDDPRRQVYDALSAADAIHVWSGWIAIGDMRVEGRNLIFESDYIRDGVIERAGAVLDGAGFTIAEAA